MKAKIVTPLRYPGGKTRAIKILKEFIPTDYNRFIEPFVGGGSVTLYYKQLFPEREYWINDLNENLYNFWIELQNNSEKLANIIQIIRSSYKNEIDGRQAFKDAKIILNLDDS